MPVPAAVAWELPVAVAVAHGAVDICSVTPTASVGSGDALTLETLFVAEDVYSPAEIAEAVSEADVKDSELELARQVIESLEGDFEASELRSEYRRDLRALLEAKQRGEEIAMPEEAEEAPVIDLMEALKASVAAAKQREDAEQRPKAARAKAKAKPRRAKAS